MPFVSLNTWPQPGLALPSWGFSWFLLLLSPFFLSLVISDACSFLSSKIYLGVLQSLRWRPVLTGSVPRAWTLPAGHQPAPGAGLAVAWLTLQCSPRAGLPLARGLQGGGASAGAPSIPALDLPLQESPAQAQPPCPGAVPQEAVSSSQRERGETWESAPLWGPSFLPGRREATLNELGSNWKRAGRSMWPLAPSRPSRCSQRGTRI